MKVDNHPFVQPAAVESRNGTPSVKGASAPTQKGGDPATLTHLSAGLSDSSQDIDSVRVDEIREALNNGTLKIHADRIADALIESAQELAGTGDEK